MTKLLFIQTGGTIDKDYPHTTKGYAFLIHEPAVERVLKRINASVEYEMITAFKKDSLDITDDDRKQLAALVAVSHDVDKVVITHGTDTMAETAKALSPLVELTSKTIVITGAMQPERFRDSDADFNLGMAIATAQSAKPGVYVCMHGLVIPHDKIDRNMKTGQYRIKK